MRYALVPRQAGPRTATVWAAAFAEAADEPAPPEAELVVAGQRHPVRWPLAIAGAQPAVRGEELTVPVPAARTAVELVVGGACRATATVAALPAALPGPGQPPFTVLAGSCYAQARDRGRLARLVEAMHARRGPPDLKFLAGDQVYLDQPVSYAWFRRPREQLLARFLDNYRRTWSDAGLLPLLRDGAGWLVADDHEVWNEFPAARGHRGRTPAWEEVARELFAFFQWSGGERELTVPPVSFFVLDTRLDRTADRERFAADARLDELERWVGRLAGPGVLVIGEPLFGERPSLGARIGRLIGRISGQPSIAGTLRDYAQYRRLTELLDRSRHDVVILCGDVHWGRIAECRLATGARLIEIVVSPTVLVDRGRSRWFRPWTPAPSPFGHDQRPVETIGGTAPYRVCADHLVTLELTRADDHVDLALRLWLLDHPDTSGEIAWSTRLAIAPAQTAAVGR